jgi:uncharacterized protein YegL
MGHNDFIAESPENYEQKCLCVLALDVSSSMVGNPIDELNLGLQEFYRDVLDDQPTADRLEFAIVTFNSSVRTELDPALACNFKMPTLSTSGTTKLVDGVREAINIAQARKAWYKKTGQPYFRPWIILITDGAPDGDQDVNGLAEQISREVDNKGYWFFAIGVGGADMDMLRRISTSQMPPAPLQGLKFREFFKWLSASMSMVTGSLEDEKVDLPNPAAWMGGFTIQ